MKLVTFAGGEGAAALGIVAPEGAILDVARAYRQQAGTDAPEFASMLALIQAGEAGRHRLDETVRWAGWRPDLLVREPRLLAPLPRPEQLRDFMCFEQHLQNGLKRRSALDGQQHTIPQVWYDQPIYYKGNRFSTAGPEDDIVRPSYCEMFDYELELGVVIGAGGRDIPVADALDHVFGYMIFNDYSARDAQGREMVANLGPGKGKDFDTGNAFGPWLVTADEIGDPQGLEMVARVNGVECSRGNSRDMHHTVADMIAWVSTGETLYPGEVLGTGTVGGGCAFERGESIKPGDVVELEISGLGIMRNRICDARS